jgi:hypothetical protein
MPDNFNAELSSGMSSGRSGMYSMPDDSEAGGLIGHEYMPDLRGQRPAPTALLSSYAAMAYNGLWL